MLLADPTITPSYASDCLDPGAYTYCDHACRSQEIFDNYQESIPE